MESVKLAVKAEFFEKNMLRRQTFHLVLCILDFFSYLCGLKHINSKVMSKSVILAPEEQSIAERLLREIGQQSQGVIAEIRRRLSAEARLDRKIAKYEATMTPEQIAWAHELVETTARQVRELKAGTLKTYPIEQLFKELEEEEAVEQTEEVLCEA